MFNMLSEELYNIANYLNYQYKTTINFDMDRYVKFICAAEIELLLHNICYPLDKNIRVNLENMRDHLLRNDKH